MRKSLYVLSLLVCLVSYAFAGSNTIVPTTTLAAETGNNTSGAATFATQTNGNIAPANVSKLPIRSLLYSGATTKVYAHLVPWFGGANHMNVGYASNNAAQVSRQAADMVSRGIDGVIIDWYGPNFSRENQSSLLWKAEAETRGMEFAIMEDGGALKACSRTLGCDVTQRMIDDLNYAYTTYVQSPAYMRINGRPVYFFFGVEAYVIDWARVRANVVGNPYLIQRNSGPFSSPNFDGAYAWLASEMVTGADPSALLYLQDFYYRANQAPNKLASGSTYPGFNDTLASWGSGRIINQRCGQTWLESMAFAGRYYSSNRQLPMMQLVTWNDYEEGSEIETGIENCVSVTANVSEGNLTWSISGEENTLDHFKVFISADGQNLMELGQVSASARSMNLAAFGFAGGNYQVYVKAVAKASMTNKMSNAASYSVVNLAPVVSVSASAPSGPAPSASVTATITASDSDGSIASSTIDFGNGTVISGLTGTATYSTAGTYTITATVTDNAGATATSTTTVMVAANRAPVVNVSVDALSGIAPLTVTANAAASDPDGGVTSTIINFGNGTVVNSASGSATYTAAGTYTITATTTDSLGAVTTSTTTVTVTAPRRVNILSPGEGSAFTSPVRFVASAESGSTVSAMQIYVDDQLVYQGNGANVDARLTLLSGMRRVVIKGWDANGDFSRSMNVNVRQNVSPVAVLSATPTTGSGSLTVTASNAASTDSDGTIVSRTIDFGNGTVINGASGSVTYTTPGIYTIRTTVTDDGGATSTATQSVTVSAPAPYVTITSPVASSKVPTSMRVQARGWAASGVRVMQVYVDGKLAYQINGNTVDTTITVAVGQRHIAVKGWDMLGNNFVSSVTVNAYKSTTDSTTLF